VQKILTTFPDLFIVTAKPNAMRRRSDYAHLRLSVPGLQTEILRDAPHLRPRQGEGRLSEVQKPEGQTANFSIYHENQPQKLTIW
jgi:hypothetical protein